MTRRVAPIGALLVLALVAALVYAAAPAGASFHFIKIRELGFAFLPTST